MAYIEFQDVKKIYTTGDVEVHALDGADFSIEKGELCVILGQSGAGSLTVGKNVEAISGATVSSKGVTKGVNGALAVAEALG